VGAPNQLLARPMRVTLIWLAGTALVLILTGLTAATVLGRRIDGSVARLEETARALGDGTLHQPGPLPVRDLDFVQDAMWTAGRDIAARRITERQLLADVQHGRDLLQAVVDGSDDLIFARDRENRLVLANQATATLCGLSSGKDEVGHRLDDLIPPGDWPDIAPLDAADPGAGRRVLTADGRMFEVSHSPLRDGKAQRVGTISIAREVTQRVAAEARLGRLQSDLARAGRLSAVAAMGAGLAHELHQPLSAAANFLAVATLRLVGLTGAPPTAVAAVRDAMAETSAQVLRTGEILQRLQRFIGKVDMEVAVLAPLIREAAEAAWRQAGPARGRLTLQLDETLQALVDPVSIQQVVSNIVRNAAEALGGQGDVWIVLEPAADGSACVSVLDTGPGIDPATADRLFDVFSGSGKKGGLGVGLAICRTIVAAHGGWMTAANHERGGAAFAFTLPPQPHLLDADSLSLQQAC
jgi:PAS domain S-box-containing protein